jgi:alkylated DNA repair dioxygenase AlkB
MEQLSFFDSGRENNNLPAGLLDYRPGFFSLQESAVYIEALKAGIDWKQETIQMYGKVLNTPRLTAWYGEADKTYTFSGKTFHPSPWTPELLQIRDRVAWAAGTPFNSVLLNFYRNGNDSVAWHADDEPELGINPVIASVSFGQVRRFELRHKHDHKLKHALELENGSLLMMRGDLQHNWQHQVPKSKKPMSERVNLTFRVIA